MIEGLQARKVEYAGDRSRRDELKDKVFADLAGNVEEFLALAKDERQGALDDHLATLEREVRRGVRREDRRRRRSTPS